MKRRYALLFSLLLAASAMIVLQAQASSSDGKQPAPVSSNSDLSAQPAAAQDGPAKKYRLDAFVQTIKGKKYLKVTTNLRLTDRNYGGSPVPGEGHIHYYLDGKIVGPITSMKLYPLDNLHEGANLIRLVLAENNHREDFGVSTELTVVLD